MVQNTQDAHEAAEARGPQTPPEEPQAGTPPEEPQADPEDVRVKKQLALQSIAIIHGASPFKRERCPTQQLGQALAVFGLVSIGHAWSCLARRGHSWPVLCHAWP